MDHMDHSSMNRLAFRWFCMFHCGPYPLDQTGRWSRPGGRWHVGSRWITRNTDVVRVVLFLKV